MRKKKSFSNKLTPIQYWKWCNSIEEMNHGKTKLRLAISEFEREKLLVSNHQLKVELLKVKLSDCKKDNDELELNYKNIKKDIEKELNISLDNCAVDPYDYSIKQL